MAPENGVAVPKMVELAERWARELGYPTDRTEGTRSDGSTVPSLVIQYGAVSLLCNEHEGTLRVLAVMDVSPETRAQLRKLDAGASAQLLSALKLALTQNPRGGFSCYPSGFRHAAEIEQISLHQRFKVADGDLGSFNRFLDALQEVSVGAIRLAAVFEPYYARG